MKVVEDKRKYQTGFLYSGMQWPGVSALFALNQELRVYNLFETVNGRKKLTLMDLGDYIMD